MKPVTIRIIFGIEKLVHGKWVPTVFSSKSYQDMKGTLLYDVLLNKSNARIVRIQYRIEKTVIIDDKPFT